MKYPAIAYMLSPGVGVVRGRRVQQLGYAWLTHLSHALRNCLLHAALSGSSQNFLHLLSKAFGAIMRSDSGVPELPIEPKIGP